jgi:NTE family protein
MQDLFETQTGLVLSGGGAYGAYEVGVIKALFEGKCPSTDGKPLDPRVFSGTSVGSFNAAILAMNQGGALAASQRLVALWKEEISDNNDGKGNGVYRIRGNPSEYFDLRTPGSPLEQLNRFIDDTKTLSIAAVPRLLNLLTPDGHPFQRLEGLVDVSAFLNVDPFCHLVQSQVDPTALRASAKALRVTATNWITGDSRDFDFHETTDDHAWAAIRASAAIPGLFPPVKLDGQTYVDGGVVQNTPIMPAIEEGATEIHVISLNPKMTALPIGAIDNTVNTFIRVYMAMLSSKISEDIELARWINEFIDLIERLQAGQPVEGGKMKRFAQLAGIISQSFHEKDELPKMLTIHRYYPARELGALLGMLNFHRPVIDTMIDAGYSDACAHDCKANNCVLPPVPTPVLA